MTHEQAINQVRAAQAQSKMGGFRGAAARGFITAITKNRALTERCMGDDFDKTSALAITKPDQRDMYRTIFAMIDAGEMVGLL